MTKIIPKRNVGNLMAFQNQMKTLQEGEYDYHVEYSGNKRRIIYLDGNLQPRSISTYFGKSAEERFQGAHIVKEVKRELLQRIDAGEKPPKFIPRTNVVSFNKPQIIDTIDNLDGKCIAMDINSCYWVTANLLGIVSDRLFEKYMENPKKWKKGLVSSIGALNKKTATCEFKEGKIQTHYMGIEFGQLRPYYWAVINRVHDVMNAVIAECGDDYLMWLTDCVYVKAKSEDTARQVMGSYGYDVSKMNALMISVNKSAIHFRNDKKDLPTYINYSERQDISSDFYND